MLTLADTFRLPPRANRGWRRVVQYSPPFRGDSMASDPAPEWLLVDGSSLIFRAFYGVPSSVKGPDGKPVNAIRGFIDNLAFRVTERRPQRVVVATDEDWRPQWRVDLLPSYKTHRTAEPIPPDLDRQMPLIMECLAAVGVSVMGIAGLEAEDVIAAIAEKTAGSVEVLSGDRDLFALVEDPRVRVLYPEKGGLAVITEAEIEKRYGIPGRAYSDFAILRGDPSDGLPGVPGIGAKKAADLIRKYGSVQGMLDAGALREADADYVKRALQVVGMSSDVVFTMPEARRDTWPADAALVEQLAARHGIANSLERLVRALSADS